MCFHADDLLLNLNSCLVWFSVFTTVRTHSTGTGTGTGTLKGLCFTKRFSASHYPYSCTIKLIIKVIKPSVKSVIFTF